MVSRIGSGWVSNLTNEVRISRLDCLSSPNGATLSPRVMNSIHVALAVLLATITCFAQGQVNFANRVGAGGSILNVPVTINATIQGSLPSLHQRGAYRGGTCAQGGAASGTYLTGENSAQGGDR